MRRALLLLALAGSLDAESRLALRSSAALLRESPAEIWFVDTGSFSSEYRRVYPHDWDLAFEQSARWYGGHSLGAWRAEWNLLGLASEASEPGLLPAERLQDGRNRALEGWSPVHGDAVAKLELDQLNLRWQGSRASIIVGRQGVNLGVGFYFSPLDLFAPFNPLESYREFRPGVDAVRATWSPSDYSIVEVLGVAGYVSPTGSALPPPPDAFSLDGSDGQGSLLGRVQANGGAWSLTLQGGWLRNFLDVGGAVQLEAWGSSWTLEGDFQDEQGHRAVPGKPYSYVTHHHWSVNAGHSHQWNSWLSTRLEGGLTDSHSSVTYLTNVLPEERHLNGQAAFSAQAQATPLWMLSGTWLRHWSSSASEQLLFTAERSLSDESSLTLSLGAPVIWPGEADPPDLYSPYSFSLELRTTL